MTCMSSPNSELVHRQVNVGGAVNADTTTKGGWKLESDHFRNQLELVPSMLQS